jgi:hypothetical protein
MEPSKLLRESGEPAAEIDAAHGSMERSFPKSLLISE